MAMQTEPTFRDLNLRVFRREPLPHVFFQPRIEPWFARQKRLGDLPPELASLEVREVFDRIGASMRYVDYYTGMPSPITSQRSPKVKSHERRTDQQVERRYETPYGELSECFQLTTDKSWRRVTFLAKRVEDLRALAWLLGHDEIRFDPKKFREGDAYVGPRGVGQFYLPKSPYFAMAQQFMKYEDFVFALTDAPQKVEEVMRAIDESYEGLYEGLRADQQVRIINYGENIAMAYLSPRYFEQYVIPWYQKRSGQLRAAGKFTHIHIDGYFRPLLRYLATLPFDGIEALTPIPQGDVTLEEMRDAMGDKILLDGIPAILFLDHHPREQLEACVEKLVAYFHPRLVLGISDELPEGGNAESYERLAWVAKWAREQTAVPALAH